MPLAAHTSLPPLRDGDCLTRDEFLRRWEAMPELKHAQLIEGIVYMASPVGKPHSRFQFLLSYWLGHYVTHTPGCEGGVEGTWLMGERNVPQPDIALSILPEYGGQSREEGNYATGAPELAIEVAASSRARDLGPKKKLYERMGVLEYLVAIPAETKLIWHQLTPTGYQLLEPGADGIFRSHFFAGLWLDAAALWSLDTLRILTVLERGLATPEHAAFVNQLLARKK